MGRTVQRRRGHGRTARIEENLAGLGSFQPVGHALVQFARDSFRGSDFRPQGRRWILEPVKCVAFAVAGTRRRASLEITLRGNIDEFVVVGRTRLHPRSNSKWCYCRIHQPSQLLAAASYVKRASELFRQSQNRLIGRAGHL